MSNLVNQLPVGVVRWPVDAAAREACQRSGTLCLLVLEKNVPAPVLTDIREDWVRAPVPHQDLASSAPLAAASNRPGNKTPGGPWVSFEGVRGAGGLLFGWFARYAEVLSKAVEGYSFGHFFQAKW